MAIGNLDRRRDVGKEIRRWRSVRRLSQLELAGMANISARHLSFIETGRGNASTATLLALADSLDIPLQEQNRLLLAAGFAPRFSEAKLGDTSLAHAKEIVRLILESHDPYPAYAIDNNWNVTASNKSQQTLSAILLERDTIGRIGGNNVLRLLFHPDGLRNHIVNWEQISQHMIKALNRQSLLRPEDKDLHSLIEDISEWVGDLQSIGGAKDPGLKSFALPITYRVGNTRISMITTMLRFSSPFAAAVEGLTIETFYPADEVSQEALNSLTTGS